MSDEGKVKEDSALMVLETQPERLATIRRMAALPGLPAQNCQYCHVSKAPTKSTYKPDDLNDRGKWMITEKDKLRAKDVKAEWLKEYPGGKEQK